MNTERKLTYKWLLNGMAMYAGWGLIGYFGFGSEAMKEPPPYFAATMTLLIALSAAIREAYLAGLNHAKIATTNSNNTNAPATEAASFPGR